MENLTQKTFWGEKKYQTAFFIHGSSFKESRLNRVASENKVELKCHNFKEASSAFHLLLVILKSLDSNAIASNEQRSLVSIEYFFLNYTTSSKTREQAPNYITTTRAEREREQAPGVIPM